MSRDLVSGGPNTGVVFHETGDGGSILLLREDGDRGTGVLISGAARGGVPLGRTVELFHYNTAMAALQATGRDSEDCRAQIARLALCRAAGLKLGPPGAESQSGTARWLEFLGEEDIPDEEDRLVEVPGAELERGWGTLVAPDRNSPGLLVPAAGFWAKNLALSPPIDSFRCIGMLRQIAGKTGNALAGRMVERTVGLNLEAARHALRAVGDPAGEAVNYYGEESPESADRRQAAEIYPLFAGMIARSGTLREVVRERRSLQEALQEATGFAPAALRRLSKIDTPPPVRGIFDVRHEAVGEDAIGVQRRRLYTVSGRAGLEDSLAVLSEADSSWAPDSNESWEAFTTILGSGVLPLSMMLERPPHELVRTSKGNWTGWLKALAKDAGYDDGEPLDRRRFALAMSDALHGVYDLSQRVLLPLCLSSVRDRHHTAEEADSNMVSAAFRSALSVVCGSAKNPLGALLSFSRVYVSRVGYLGALVAENTARKGADEEDEAHRLLNTYPEGHWPPLIPEGEWSYGDTTITCLSSGTALRREGKEMSHCVGGYAAHGEAGNHHFLSLRGPGTDDRSTAQLRAGSLDVVQHYSYRNCTSPRNHRNALAAFREGLGDGTIEMSQGLEEWREAAQALMEERRAADKWAWLCDINEPHEGVVPEIWEEWKNILGGAAAKAEFPGILYRHGEVRDLVRLISPRAAVDMEREAREQREARERAREIEAAQAAGQEPGERAGEAAAPAPA